jgi:putative redox protein
MIYSPPVWRNNMAEFKNITVEWKGDMNFVGRNQTGGQVQIGSSEGKPGIGPMELVLAAMAGCTGMDIVSILNKKRVELTNFTVKTNGVRAETHPMVYTEINVEYLLWGNDLKPNDVEQAIQLSEEKYCSVGVMLGATAKIKSSYQILKPGESAK